MRSKSRPRGRLGECPRGLVASWSTRARYRDPPRPRTLRPASTSPWRNGEAVTSIIVIEHVKLEYIGEKFGCECAPERGRADTVEGERVRVCISGRSGEAKCVEEQVHDHILKDSR